MNLKIKEVLHLFLEEKINAYLVGGCVRDFYLGRTTFDIDIAVEASFFKTMEVLNSFKPVQRFHSFFFTIEPFHFTVTPFRIEGAYGRDRKPIQIIETKQIEKDSMRRDFTINALYQRIDGSILDFYGGLSDLKKGVIRSIGDPMIRLKEDPLRILRAIRFASILSFEVEESLSKAILECAPFLSHISLTRKREELEKLYRGDPIIGFTLLEKYHLHNFLEIRSPFLMTPTILGLLPQFQRYPLSKKERKIVERMLYYIHKEEITRRDLIECTLEEWENICFLKGISFIEIENTYKDLPLHTVKELAFPYEIFKDDFSKIRKAKEKALDLIFSGKLTNEKEAIRQYLTNCDTK